MYLRESLLFTGAFVADLSRIASRQREALDRTGVHDQTGSNIGTLHALHDPVDREHLRSHAPGSEFKREGEWSSSLFFQWKTSAACSNLSNLMSRLHLCLHQGRFPFADLNTRLKLVENSPAVRRYVSQAFLSPFAISDVYCSATIGICHRRLYRLC